MDPRKSTRIQRTPAIPPIERRKHPRNGYCTDILLACPRGDFSGKVLNVSADGMFIQTDTQFCIGEILDLTFIYRSSQWSACLRSAVVRTTPAGIGVRILES